MVIAKLFIISLATLSNSAFAAEKGGEFVKKEINTEKDPKNFDQAKEAWSEAERNKREADLDAKEKIQLEKELAKALRTSSAEQSQEYLEAHKKSADAQSVVTFWKDREAELNKNAEIQAYKQTLGSSYEPVKQEFSWKSLRESIGNWVNNLVQNISVSLQRFWGNKDEISKLRLDLTQLKIDLGAGGLLKVERASTQVKDALDDLNSYLGKRISALESYQPGEYTEQSRKDLVKDIIEDLMTTEKYLRENGLFEKNDIGFKIGQHIDNALKDFGLTIADRTLIATKVKSPTLVNDLLSSELTLSDVKNNAELKEYIIRQIKADWSDFAANYKPQLQAKFGSLDERSSGIPG